MLRAVFRASERVGLAATIVGVLGWLGACLALAHSMSHVLQMPLPLWSRILLTAALAAVALLTAASALAGWWLVAGHIDYRVRGYRICRLSGSRWRYEERGGRGVLPFTRVVVKAGYPSDCRVGLLSAVAWESAAPVWARGRRAEIMQRIAVALGADRGARIDFE